MDKYSRIKFIVTKDSPRALVQMFAEAAAKARKHKRTMHRAFANADVVTS